MFGRSKKRQKSTRVDTIIGKTTTIKGDLSFSGTLHVEGTIIGNVKAETDEDAMLVLDEDGMIEGDVDVANMIVNGTVEGDIFSAGHAELLPHARIRGNVYYRLIEMSVGSEVNGNLVRHKEESGQVEYLETREKPEADAQS